MGTHPLSRPSWSLHLRRDCFLGGHQDSGDWNFSACAERLLSRRDAGGRSWATWEGWTWSPWWLEPESWSTCGTGGQVKRDSGETQVVQRSRGNRELRRSCWMLGSQPLLGSCCCPTVVDAQGPLNSQAAVDRSTHSLRHVFTRTWIVSCPDGDKATNRVDCLQGLEV
jgi:hypothetical protein